MSQVDRFVLGVDVGKYGGWAIIREDGELLGEYPIPMNKKLYDIPYMLDTISLIWGAPSLVAIESQSARPGQGVVSMFTFGTGYGQLIGATQAMQWPIRLINAKMWKKSILMGQAKDKKATIEYVKLKYPKAKLRPGKTGNATETETGIADAICIAEWARKELLGVS